MSTETSFPPVVKGALVTDADLPTELRGTVTGSVKLYSSLRRHEGGGTTLENTTNPPASDVIVDVRTPGYQNKTQYWAVGDLRAIAAAIIEHADALDETLEGDGSEQ
jgi:hypothetical protein